MIHKLTSKKIKFFHNATNFSRKIKFFHNATIFSTNSAYVVDRSIIILLALESLNLYSSFCSIHSPLKRISARTKIISDDTIKKQYQISYTSNYMTYTTYTTIFLTWPTRLTQPTWLTIWRTRYQKNARLETFLP